MEEFLITLVAGTQDHKLHGELHHIMNDLADQIQALMGHQAGHHSNDGGMRLLPQAGHLLQLRLIRRLASQVRSGEVAVNPGIGSGVIELHVDAVEHAGELIGALAHDTLHPMGEVGHFQLVGVGRRDRVHGVGTEDRALEQIHVAVHQQRAVLDPAAVQAEEVSQHGGVVTALILDIVDGQDGFDTAVPVLPHAVVLQVNGHQCGLPVIAVNHVGPELHMVQHPHHGPGEKAEALAIVHLSVKVAAVEVLLVVQEVPGHAVLLQGEQSAVAMPPRQVHIVIAKEIQLIAVLRPHPVIKRQDHGDLRALFRQRRGEGTGHIRETAGFTKRDGLTGYVQNLHTLSPFHTLPHTGKLFQEHRKNGIFILYQKKGPRSICHSIIKGRRERPPFIEFTPCCPLPEQWDR